ncbi:MAG: deoxyribose-phosphate aldolase [Clostridia bacterium]|jgi:deoxyribose-phosphate aldolase|nr:deoxyribose-phosphate aldolase [Clostridia bacterium]
MTHNEVAAMIDHTLLKPEAGERDILALCQEAREYGLATVCINPVFVKMAAKELAGSQVGICTVIGFPLGATTSRQKGQEAAEAVLNGATELDMVINISFLKDGNLNELLSEIQEVVKSAQGRPVKVILETCYLNDGEKVLGAQTAVRAGARYVKTSTGFGPGGATFADVQLLRETVGPTVGVKASGGIRTLQALQEMVRAGANRIGTSSGIAIIGELK